MQAGDRTTSRTSARRRGAREPFDGVSARLCRFETPRRYRVGRNAVNGRSTARLAYDEMRRDDHALKRARRPPLDLLDDELRGARSHLLPRPGDGGERDTQQIGVGDI